MVRFARCLSVAVVAFAVGLVVVGCESKPATPTSKSMGDGKMGDGKMGGTATTAK